MNKWLVLLTLLPAIVALVLALLPGTLIGALFNPRIEGFFCDDESIRLPVKPDSFTNRLLIAFTLAPFFIVIIFSECLNGFFDYSNHGDLKNFHSNETQTEVIKSNVAQLPSSSSSSSPPSSPSSSSPSPNIFDTSGENPNNTELKASVKDYIFATLRKIGHVTFAYLYGQFFIFSVIFLMKFTVGRPRPSFIEVCMPIYTNPNMTCDDSMTNRHVYIDNYTCKDEESRAAKILDARTSFPSGHAAMATFAAVFITIYLHNLRNCRRFVSIAKIVLQTYLLLTALYASVSRVSDHRHHGTDVAAGIVIGIVVAISMIKYMNLKDSSKKISRTSSVCNRKTIN